MATFKIINKQGKYHDLNSTSNVIQYIFNPEKTESRLYGFEQVDPMCPAKSMVQVSRAFGKQKGIQIRHYIISFYQNEVDNPHTADRIAKNIALYIGYEYQTVYAVHESTDQIHIHIVHNTVSYVDSHRYRGNKMEYYTLLNIIYIISDILKRYGVKRLITLNT
ncbi:MAG: relaxase/mobilization nuclease domain-containing protein [Clostridia bacterium]|nr:relaxase/mobilization nuclease domain-containing protein [Clostridia bacterium]